MTPGPWQGVLALTRAQIRRGHRVEVVSASNPRYPSEPNPGVPVHRVFGAGTHFFRTYTATYGASCLVEVLRRQRRGEVDMVHTHDLDTALVAWARRRRILGVPLAAHCHTLRRSWIELGVFREWERVRGPLQRANLHLQGGVDFALERESLVGADVVFAVSASVKRDLVRYLGIPPGRIHVTYNGVDLERFRPGVGPPPVALPPGPRILTVGGGDPRKGVFQVLEVARVFQREGWPGSFVVAGNAGEALRARAPPNVHFPGYIPHGELPRLYAHCDLYFLPSLGEGFVKSVLEAMACARPVVVTPVGGNPEMVTPETGHLVPPEPVGMARVLHGLLGDPEGRRRMGEMGRRRVVEHFTWERVAERVEAGYRQAIEGRG